MDQSRRRPDAIGIPWYDRANYAAARARMRDADLLPATFEAWFYRAQKLEEQLRRAGIATIRANVDGDAFAVFCRERGLELDAEGRNQFASWCAYQVLAAKHGGQA